MGKSWRCIFWTQLPIAFQTNFWLVNVWLQLSHFATAPFNIWQSLSCLMFHNVWLGTTVGIILHDVFALLPSLSLLSWCQKSSSIISSYDELIILDIDHLSSSWASFLASSECDHNILINLSNKAIKKRIWECNIFLPCSSVVSLHPNTSPKIPKQNFFLFFKIPSN